MIKVRDREEKHPQDMVNMELLEKYSHYNRMTFRLKDEQDYTAQLRQEMLKRMEGESSNG